MRKAMNGPTFRSIARHGARPVFLLAGAISHAAPRVKPPVYALVDWGIRCVIAPSFGDIFAGNAVQNGLLTAVVRDEEAAVLMAALGTEPSCR